MRYFCIIFTMLMLGCGNENPVSEANRQIVEIEEPSLAWASVYSGDVAVDPTQFNLNGITIAFNEPIAVGHMNLHFESGRTLGWDTQWSANREMVTLTPPNPCAALQHNNAYVIEGLVQGYGGHTNEISITFRTKASDLAVAPDLNVEEPYITRASVYSGDVGVDPTSLNLNGITIAFNEPIAVGHLNLRLKYGSTLGWDTQWSANREMVTLTPPNPCAALQHNNAYVIEGLIKDDGCNANTISITFRTKASV